MFSSNKTSFTSSHLSSYSHSELSGLLSHIPGYEDAVIGQNIAELSSPEGVMLELNLPDGQTCLLCVYDIKQHKIVKDAWDFAFHAISALRRIFRYRSKDKTALRRARFSVVGDFSYVILPVIGGSYWTGKLAERSLAELFVDFVMITALPNYLKREQYRCFVDSGREAESLIYELNLQLSRAKEDFSREKEFVGLAEFLHLQQEILVNSRLWDNRMQLSPQSLNSIMRREDASLFLSRPLCLEFSIMDIGLCDLLYIVSELNSVAKSMLVHVYYNLSVPSAFFSLLAIDTFIRIMNNWVLPYSERLYKLVLQDLRIFKNSYRSFKNMMPSWYHEPTVNIIDYFISIKQNVTYLYPDEKIKRSML